VVYVDHVHNKNTLLLLSLGTQLKLTASVGGRPQPTIEWLKDNVPLKSSPSIDIKSTSSLCTVAIRSATPKDAGVYTCVAKNEVGECKADCNVKIEASKVKPKPSSSQPAFTVELEKEYSGEEGDEVTLGVEFTGKPKPKVTWEKNGSNIVSIKRVKIIDEEGSSKLVIKTLRESDFGDYTCTISNFKGSTTCTTCVKSGEFFANQIFAL